jgi:hypothetical protein
MKDPDWKKGSKNGKNNLSIYNQINKEFKEIDGINYSTICNVIREIERECSFNDDEQDF